MVIDNTIKLAVLPLASNYVCASREFVLFLQSNRDLCQYLPCFVCGVIVFLFKLIIIGYLYVGTEPYNLTQYRCGCELATIKQYMLCICSVLSISICL